MKPEQLDHSDNKFQQRQFPLTVVCDGIHSASNTGSLFRVAEAFGVEEIIFCVYLPEFSRRMEKTARSTHQRVAHRFEPETAIALKALKEDGYTIIALEITNNSISLNEVTLKKPAKVALLLGGENHGISAEHLAMADQHVHIDMYGVNSSMNVSMAAGICLFELTNLLK
ncbi:TrmH family RNA methyltransferase [Robertkochia marina]|uniref:TrmH family RNA methyltransferase n=2 Tax=Robertkochia marina TaxID=1227945 RepID=A0A4S3LZ82_9FLAO|nr:RNA methyltransferase [Robertkochia marina]THD66746.1 TrmH family RNA methyltransferase [Robertkochia marina]TRZ42364.1 TrmH family RNA methyltransferase [Robertkochia marina]